MVPIDLQLLRAMKRSSLGVDIYLWLSYRMNRLTSPVNVTWNQLHQQFGANPDSTSRAAVYNFRRNMLGELNKIKLEWPGLRYQIKHGYLRLLPSTRRIKGRRAAAFSTE